MIRARDLDHPLSLAYALLLDATLGQLSCDHSVAGERAGAARSVAGNGLAAFEGWASVIHGWAIVMGGDADEGLRTMRDGLDATAASDSTIMRPYLLGLLADALACDGYVDEGLRALDEAVALVETNNNGIFKPSSIASAATCSSESRAVAGCCRGSVSPGARGRPEPGSEIARAARGVSAARLLASQERAREGCASCPGSTGLSRRGSTPATCSKPAG